MFSLMRYSTGFVFLLELFPLEPLSFCSGLVWFFGGSLRSAAQLWTWNLPLSLCWEFPFSPLVPVTSYFFVYFPVLVKSVFHEVYLSLYSAWGRVQKCGKLLWDLVWKCILSCYLIDSLPEYRFSGETSLPPHFEYIAPLFSRSRSALLNRNIMWATNGSLSVILNFLIATFKRVKRNRWN